MTGVASAGDCFSVGENIWLSLGATDKSGAFPPLDRHGNDSQIPACRNRRRPAFCRAGPGGRPPPGPPGFKKGLETEPTRLLVMGNTIDIIERQGGKGGE